MHRQMQTFASEIHVPSHTCPANHLTLVTPEPPAGVAEIPDLLFVANHKLSNNSTTAWHKNPYLELYGRRQDLKS